jgi:hypothetical protein
MPPKNIFFFKLGLKVKYFHSWLNSNGGTSSIPTDVAPFGATSDRRIACADVALNGSHLRICEISPRIAASLLPLQNLANPAIR